MASAASATEALSFGTLATAVYKAYEKDPDNANVKRTIAAGLPNAVVFHPRLPKDVIIFLRDHHNKFHEGSSISFAEADNAQEFFRGL